MNPNASAKVCAFCGRSGHGVKMTREHIIPRSLHDVLPRSIGRLFQQNFKHGAHQVDKNLEDSIWEAVINKVCDDCNNVWLSETFERPALSLLRALVLGWPVSVLPMGQHVLRKWAYKTALVRALGDTKVGCLLPFAYRRLRETSAAPALVRVWMGRHHGEGCSRTSHAIVSAKVDGRMGVVETATFVLGAVVFHVLFAEYSDGSDPAELYECSGRIDLCPGVAFSMIEIPACPQQPLSWPFLRRVTAEYEQSIVDSLFLAHHVQPPIGPNFLPPGTPHPDANVSPDVAIFFVGDRAPPEVDA